MAAFSDADPKDWVRAPVLDGPFSHAFVNAESQQTDETSMLSTMQRLIRARRACREIGWGDIVVVDLPEDRIVALTSSWRGGKVLTLHNLSEEPVAVDLGPVVGNTHARNLLRQDASLSAGVEGECTLRLAAYGFTNG